MSSHTYITVLHGTCHFTTQAATFFFWSESTESRKLGRDQVHPFSNSVQGTRNAMRSGGLLSGVSEEPAKLVSIMPSLDGLPIPSGELEGLISSESRSDTSEYSLKSYDIEGLSLSLRDALHILVALEDSYLDGKIMIGSDLRFWRSVSSLLASLLAEGKVLPGVVEENSWFRSKWIVLLDTEKDQEAVRNLAKAMPGVCLMFDSERIDAESMVKGFIDSAADSSCRRFANQVTTKGSMRTHSDVINWASSLGSDDPNVTLTRSVSIQKLSSWTMRLQTRMEFPFQASFEVLPPETDGDQWKLNFTLKSRADPSLILPFSRIWDKRDRDARALIKKYVEYPEEFLLQSLGTVQSIFPPLQRALRQPNPSELTLSSNELYSFLSEVSPTLQESGFSVMFPEWWMNTRKSLGVRVSAKPVKSSLSRLGTDALVQYSMEVVFDGDPLSAEELSRIASMKTPIVRIGRKWVQVDQEQLSRVLSLLKERRNGTLSELLSIHTKFGSLPVLEIRGEGWIQDLLDGNAKIESIRQPRGFRGKLREYQKTGTSWLKFMTTLSLGCCLADDMGLGKTIEVIAFLLDRKSSMDDAGPVLILCPTSVISNWGHELKKFAPRLRVMIHHGPARLRGDAFVDMVIKADVVLTSYALLHRDMEFLSQIVWDGVISDEAQYIKNYSTKQSKAIRSLRAGFRIAMTGTPVENRLEDLRSIFEFINPGYLGSEKKFREMFVLPIEREQDDGATRMLNRFVSPFILRREKTDRSIIKDLPEKGEVKVYIPVTEEQATLYEAAVKAMLQEINESEGMQRKGLILSTITRLKRLLDHPAMVSGDNDFRADRSEKLTRLLDMIGEIVSNRDKVIVFTQYVEAARIIKENIQMRFHQECLFLSGNTPRTRREEMIARFQDLHGPGIFVISLRAGGFGINLTAATNVIHFDRWWNPSVEDQATDRAYRIGQTRSVSVYKYVVSGTVEERIDDIIEAKTDLRKKVIGGSDESWVTELSSEQLKDLFSLRRDVIASGSDV